MEKEKIDRINCLARKQREQGLTEEEKAEQQALRSEYRQGFRNGLAQQLDNVYYKMPDGSVVKAVKGGVKINTEGKK